MRLSQNEILMITSWLLLDCHSAVQSALKQTDGVSITCLKVWGGPLNTHAKHVKKKGENLTKI